jgi:hypothetical protein
VVAGPDAEVDRLEAESASRLTAPVVVVAILLVATLVALGIASRPAHRHTAATPPPPPTPLSLPVPLLPRSRPDQGSVFLEHLGRCTHTDGLRFVTVAVGVTNLSDHALRLVSATSLGGSSGLRLDDVRVGTHACAVTSATIQRPRGTLLGPSHAVVVSLRFAVGPDCPSAAVIAARVTFVGDHGALHADSSSLADLSGLRFAQCPARAG